jgi:hypothetical protein
MDALPQQLAHQVQSAVCGLGDGLQKLAAGAFGPHT